MGKSIFKDCFNIEFRHFIGDPMCRYIDYLKLEEIICNDEGNEIEIFHLDIRDDPEIFTEWAKQFRRNYCSDEILELMTTKIGIESSNYLNEYKLPSVPSTKSGDFGEILVSDFLQYFKDYLVPRTRFNSRVNKDRPTLGSDTLGYKYNPEEPHNAEVIVIEVKSSASGKNDSKAKNKLQEAINDSNKDFERVAMSIVASYEKLLFSDQKEADIVSRFLNIIENPFKITYGAAAIHSNTSFDLETIRGVITKNHSGCEKLRLLVIHSEKLMDFINKGHL